MYDELSFGYLKLIAKLFYFISNFIIANVSADNLIGNNI